MFNVVKKQSILLFILLISAANHVYPFAVNSMFGHDPYPKYSTVDPHEFLYRRTRQELKGLDDEFEGYGVERVRFSISPFGQYADRGRTFLNEDVYLGDLGGRWSMIPLIFGDAPKGQKLPNCLTTAQTALFGAGNVPQDLCAQQSYIDHYQRFGFFTVPLKYRKRGARFEIEFLLVRDFGLYVQSGFSDINQTLENPCEITTFCGLSLGDCLKKCSTDESGFEVCTTTTNSCRYTGYCPEPIDLTPCYPDDTIPDWIPTEVTSMRLSKSSVEYYLMNRYRAITREMGICLNNFNECSIEDIHFNFYWRHAFDINPEVDDWSHILVIPYLVARFTAATGRIKEPSWQFALPFGNNGHNAFGFKGGINIDFKETIEIGGEFGVTHFFCKSFCNFRVPNNEFQQGLFPFCTNVRVKPGLTCFGSLKMSVYHLIGKLSFYFQYVAMVHQKDQICLCNPDPAFKPWVLERVSDWKSQVANMSFNYDISPNISLGFLWQAPLTRKRAYRSSTAMFGFNVVY